MYNVTFPRNIAAGFCPERRDTNLSRVDEYVHNHIVFPARKILSKFEKFERIAQCVNEHADTFKNMTDLQLQEEVSHIRVELRTKEADLPIIAKSFAVIREYADRCLNMRHHDAQIIGGLVLLNGRVAEMETGEGKTLVATLPACTAALAGIPVHIITVNDYLAQRDAEWMKPVYKAMGLTVGIVTHGMSLEERRVEYNCDVTYCTNKEIVFDYLKDHLALGKRPGNIQIRLERLFGGDCKADNLCLRGLCYAIVDEADSILIDEARTPLIISGPGDNNFEEQVYHQSISIAKELKEGKDFIRDEVKKNLSLTSDGKKNIEQLTEELSGFWAAKLRREVLISQALSAMHFFKIDEDYLIKDGKVQIVDEYTGRVMSDRSWERGLHQMIESKEGCEITSQKETLARISYQRFFRRYHWLAGMTGTAKEVAKELWTTYRLNVIKIPTHKPVVREAYPPATFITEEDKLLAMVEKIKKINSQGRPVLIGTPSVKSSESLSSKLKSENLSHRILNARQDEEEAEIISQAGQKGQITVATNMAGRGTDIVLGDEVREKGGLHVIATELHSARRIDRQLFGRCGRQGDPGSFESMASLEDDIVKHIAEGFLGRVFRKLVVSESKAGAFIRFFLASFAQRSLEKKHYIMRHQLMKHDESMENALAFSGRGE